MGVSWGNSEDVAPHSNAKPVIATMPDDDALDIHNRGALIALTQILIINVRNYSPLAGIQLAG